MPAGRERENQQRRGYHPDRGDPEQHHAEGARDAVDQLTHVLRGALVFVLADDRHEGLGKRAFGEQPAQEVGDLEGHQPGVHEGAGAKRGRKDDFARQARDPGNESGDTGDGGALEYGPAHPATTRKIKENPGTARTIPDTLTRWGVVSTLRAL